MESQAALILAVGLLYFVGHLLTHFFEQSKVPDVLMLILFGIIIGPLTGIVSIDPDSVMGPVFTQFALIIILFEGGMGLDVASLVHSARQSVVLTVSFFAVSTVIITLLMHYAFEYSPIAAVLTGFICAGTSSAVVIPLLGMMNVGRKTTTTLVMESALTDVLCIVFTIGQVNSVLSGDFEIGKIIGTIVSSLVIAAIIGIVSAVLWLKSLAWVRSFSNTQYATCFFMFVVFGVAELLHFSGAIAVLAYGFMLGNHMTLGRHIHILADVRDGSVSDAEKKLYKELVFLVKIFFFIYLGISIPITDGGLMLVAAAIVVALFAVRPLAARFTVSQDTPARDRSIISVMIPKGLAAAVLAGLPVSAGMVEGRDIQSITYYVVLLSIILTSVLIPLIERTGVGRFYDKLFPKDKQPEATIE